MSNILCYENSFIDVTINEVKVRISYILCSPPSRLKPKGTIILLHDSFHTSHQFRHVIDILAMGGYITIAPDLPGRLVWPQQRADPTISLEIVAGSVVGMLGAMNIQQSIHLVGDRFGAFIASVIATLHPELVASLILAGGTSAYGLQNALDSTGLFIEKECLRAPKIFRTTYSKEDVQDFAKPYRDPPLSPAMQNVYRLLASNTVQSSATTSTQIALPHLHLHASPEVEPEHFALSVLAQANQVAKQKPTPPDVYATRLNQFGVDTKFSCKI